MQKSSAQDREPDSYGSALWNCLPNCVARQPPPVSGLLLDGPVVAQPGNERRHFHVGPNECEIVSVKCVDDLLSRGAPSRHSGVVGVLLVQRSCQVPVRRLSNLRQFMFRLLGLKKFAVILTLVPWQRSCRGENNFLHSGIPYWMGRSSRRMRGNSGRSFFHSSRRGSRWKKRFRFPNADPMAGFAIQRCAKAFAPPLHKHPRRQARTRRRTLTAGKMGDPAGIDAGCPENSSRSPYAHGAAQQEANMPL